MGLLFLSHGVHPGVPWLTIEQFCANASVAGNPVSPTVLTSNRPLVIAFMFTLVSIALNVVGIFICFSLVKCP